MDYTFSIPCLWVNTLLKWLLPILDLVAHCKDTTSSSAGVTLNSGPYETAPDPDTNIDGDDNGTFNGNLMFLDRSLVIRSPFLILNL